MPSLRYSVSGSAAAFVNGGTASESMAGLLSRRAPAVEARPRRPVLLTAATARGLPRIPAQIVSRLIAPMTVLGEAAVHDALETRWKRRVHIGQRSRRISQD